MSISHPLRKQVAEFAQLLHRRGWVANHDGNVSAREGLVFAATPTATSKRSITEASVVTFDLKGQVIGSGKLFGEIGLHQAVYERRSDVGAVIHAHPPQATAIACSARNLIEAPFIAEAIVSLGPLIPCTEFAVPGVQAKAALAPWCEMVDAVLLGNHGVVTWGANLEQAFLRMELVEHLATIAIAAAPLGGVQPLPQDALNASLVARSKAGLGKAADRAVEIAKELHRGAPVVACAPAPHSNTLVIDDGRRDSLSDLIRQEIVAALK